MRITCLGNWKIMLSFTVEILRQRKNMRQKPQDKKQARVDVGGVKTVTIRIKKTTGKVITRKSVL